MFHYEKVGNLYRLMAGDEVISEGTSVSVAFDCDTFVLLKHGIYQDVAAWVVQATQSFRESGHDDMANALSIHTRQDWVLEDLNRIINNTGFLKTYITRGRDKIVNDLIEDGTPPIVRYAELLDKYNDPNNPILLAFKERHEYDPSFSKRVATVDRIFLEKKNENGEGN